MPHLQYRTRSVFGVMMIAAAALSSACGDKGGELREVTERRRAEAAIRDSLGGDSADAVEADTGFALPAFAGDTPKTAARADTAAKDGARAGATDGEWTAATREKRHGGGVAILRGLRVARQDGFDRLVLDFGAGALPGWHVEYVDSPVRQCGSGQVMQVAGQAWLLVRLRTAQAHDDLGAPTVRQRNIPLGLPVMRQLALTCDFEGEVEIVLGLASPNPSRVMELSGPNRLVVDVRQQP